MTNGSLQPKFIKPFSRGQITLPKDYREYFDIDENSWLKVSVGDGQILIKPVKKLDEPKRIKPKINRETYLKKLLKIRGAWFNEREISEVRTEIEERLKRNEKALT